MTVQHGLMSVEEMMEAVSRHSLLLQRYRAAAELAGMDTPPEDDEITVALLVVPKGWRQDAPPECVFEALQSCGFGLRWLPIGDGAPAAVLLPSPARDGG